MSTYSGQYGKSGKTIHLPVGICYLAEKCTRLSHLDLCGCLNISNRALYALQESVLHMREPGHRQFTLLVGGTVNPSKGPPVLVPMDPFPVGSKVSTK